MNTSPSTHAWLASLSVIATFALGSLGCSTPSSGTTRGAAAGAAAGAVIGAVIGHQSGETGEGAALGAAVGGAAGGIYGHNKDQRQIASSGSSRITSDADYMRLMTADEIATLKSRARASGQRNYELTDFLTAQEKANLRRRAGEEIGR